MRDVVFFIITSVLIVGLFSGGVAYHFSVVESITGEITYLDSQLGQQQKTISEQEQQINKLSAELLQRTGQLENKLASNTKTLVDYVDTAKQQSQQQISQLTGQIQQVEKTSIERTKDLEEQLSNLDISPDFSKIISQVMPAVVSVQTDKSIGSGAIITNDGYVITNQHVIEGASIIVVKTFDGQKYNAQVIGQDAAIDIAVLKIEGSFNGLQFGNSDNANIGEKVIAVGSPLGLEFTVTEGIISSTNREYSGVQYFQIDVPVNPGNSGGPLVNKLGQIVGINSRKLSGGEGIGFSIKSNQAKQIVEQFVDI